MCCRGWAWGQSDSSLAHMERSIYTTIFGMPDSLYRPSPLVAKAVPDTADLLIEEAKLHLGKPYRYGGKGPSVFDCAGFARYVYMKFGFTLPGGSAPQYRLGKEVKDRKKLLIDNKIEPQPVELFINLKGHPLTTGGLRYILNRYSGVEGTNRHVNPHAFRHTFATTMLGNGADVRMVQEMLDRYGKFAQQG